MPATLVVKDEYRREWADLVKRHANFFKHAKDDAKHVIEFNPALSELFILFALLGVELSGERHNDEELAFLYWFQIHRSDLLTDEGRKNSNKHSPSISERPSEPSQRMSSCKQSGLPAA